MTQKMPPALPTQQLSFTTSPLIGNTVPARLAFSFSFFFLTKVIVLVFEYLVLALFLNVMLGILQCMDLNNNLQYNSQVHSVRKWFIEGRVLL